ncbi:ribokinase [Malacoplasma iowae]|uniref:ribokinase n=1 Tax=Malacoplasma iowae TaxID=2116 RepID=UPI002A1878D6|nr:ribokinase [Malacoplasma iowae]WPL40401.1 ribokinase [Malacoplasma iowae]
MKKVLVIGSLNMDIVINVNKLPKEGQTIYGNNISYFCGGKGANQAVALSKMNLETYMMGCVGNDDNGDKLINSLKENNVNTSMIKKCNNPTGLASIYVSEDGSNNIVIIKGANYNNTVYDIIKNKDFIKSFDAIVCQFEIPQDVILSAFKIAKELKIKTFLNPAPIIKYNEEILNYTDYLIPNETEFEEFFKIKKPIQKISENDLNLKNKNINLIVTYGSKGVYLWKNNKFNLFESRKVNAIDTTAAGDSFIGGFVSNILSSNNIDEAINFGIDVASIAVTRKGAQQSIPSYQEVLDFYKK